MLVYITYSTSDCAPIYIGTDKKVALAARQHTDDVTVSRRLTIVAATTQHEITLQRIEVAPRPSRRPRTNASEIAAVVTAVMAIDGMAGAYSAEAFGAGWRGVAVMLVKRGYTAHEAAAIMMSKWTRYCRDAVEENVAWGRFRAKHLAAFLDDMAAKGDLDAQVADLVRGTFGAQVSA